MTLSRLMCALCMTATLATSFAGQAAEGKKWTTVRIGTEGAFRPFNFTKPDGTLDGYEIDLYKILCDSMKVTCEIVIQPFTGMIPALNAGKFDAIMSGMSATEKRREVIEFSLPYSNSGQTFAALKDSPLAKLPDTGVRFSLTKDEAGAIKELEKIKPLIAGKTIGVQTASIAANFLNHYLKGVVKVREYKTTEEHDLDLAAGRVDFIIASSTYLNGAREKSGNANMVLSGPSFIGGLLGSGSAIGLRKSDPELKKLFDEAILKAKQDGTLKRLGMKWFGQDITPL